MPLFVFLGVGVAQQASGYRIGARHAFLSYASGDDIDDAKQHALAFIAEVGWSETEIRRQKQTSSDPATVQDETLRSVAESALRTGTSIVVYADELQADD